MVSIIIPFYGHDELRVNALNNLLSYLHNQDFKGEKEVILVEQQQEQYHDFDQYMKPPDLQGLVSQSAWIGIFVIRVELRRKTGHQISAYEYHYEHYLGVLDEIEG